MFVTIAPKRKAHEMEQKAENEMAAWITVKEAAELLGMSEQWTRTLIRKGFIKGQKFSRDWLVNRASLDAYRQEQDNPPQ